ncbi:transcriptional regulator, TetR family [Bradyrhizobium sp. NFR13]|nr:transcriptional regulator, TetR family [Bradyrhizobium sp. NFR13]
MTARTPAKPMKTDTESVAAPAAPPIGLRERKRQQTRERLTKIAMELFLKRGFEETTLDDIAAAAEISRRSFFHYFASKEDLVLAWQDASTDFLVAAIAARPADEPMLLAAENALLSMAQQLESSEAIAMARLKHGNPALRARDHGKYEKMERAIAAALGNRAKDKSGQLLARLVAMITTGAMRIGGEIWLAQGASERPEALVKRTFSEIRAILQESPARKGKA